MTAVLHGKRAVSEGQGRDARGSGGDSPGVSGGGASLPNGASAGAAQGHTAQAASPLAPAPAECGSLGLLNTGITLCPTAYPAASPIPSLSPPPILPPRSRPSSARTSTRTSAPLLPLAPPPGPPPRVDPPLGPLSPRVCCRAERGSAWDIAGHAAATAKVSRAAGLMFGTVPYAVCRDGRLVAQQQASTGIPWIPGGMGVVEAPQATIRIGHAHQADSFPLLWFILHSDASTGTQVGAEA